MEEQRDVSEWSLSNSRSVASMLSLQQLHACSPEPGPIPTCRARPPITSLGRSAPGELRDWRVGTIAAMDTLGEACEKRRQIHRGLDAFNASTIGRDTGAAEPTTNEGALLRRVERAPPQGLGVESLHRGRARTCRRLTGRLATRDRERSHAPPSSCAANTAPRPVTNARQSHRRGCYRAAA